MTAMTLRRAPRRLPPLLVAAALGLACLQGCAARPPEGAPHGIVLITLDTTRGDRFDWADTDTYPAIKRLFADGLRFSQAVTPAPVTGPAHASMFTGLDPMQHGVLSSLVPLPERATTLAERLAAVGYQTAGFVSCSLLGADRGYGQGFGHFDDALESPLVRGERPVYERRGDETLARALEWLRAHDEEPFFLWLHLFDPHAPYDPPPGFRPPGFDDLETAPGLRPTIPRLGELFAAARQPPARVAEWYRRLYDGEIAFVDSLVGRLAGYLQSRPYGDRLAFVLTADHGEELADHGHFWEHNRSLYDGVMRVPLAVSYPGAEARVVEAQASVTAVAATVLEIVGAAVPEAMRRSLLAAPGEGEPVVMIKEPVGFLGPWSAAVRQPPLKFIHVEGADGMLFDLAVDPGENQDLAGERPRQAARLRELVLRDYAGPLASFESPAIEERTREALRALGYLD